MSVITDTKLPKSIGASALAESFGRIYLSPEVKGFLASLNARLVVTYMSGAEKPELEVLDKTGKVVCSIDEFGKLGGYRRWVNDELKLLEKEKISAEKIELLANFFRVAKEEGVPLPERMEESNELKFRQFHTMVHQVGENVESIKATIDNGAKEYLISKAGLLVGILYRLMLDTLSPVKIEKEAVGEALFERGVPKWIFTKLVDKQFTSNLRADSTVLLFPKGNYLKSVALTSKEIKDESFLSANEYIVQKSGGIIALARVDWTPILPVVPKPSENDVKDFLDSYMWTLNSPYDLKDILNIRAAGKSIPSFKARVKPNPKPGLKARPETDTQRVCREIHNILGMLTTTWLHMQNLVIPCADPLAYFWSKIILGTDTWDITPTHGLYEHVKESGKDLGLIKDLSNKEVLAITGEVICQNMRISTEHENGKLIINTIKNMEGKSVYVKIKKALDVKSAKYCVDLPSMRKVAVTTEVVEETKKFLGQVSAKKSKQKKYSGAAIRLTTDVLTELTVIQDHPMYDRVKMWISTTFKTGQHKLTQHLAAKLVAGEVLKYQNELLDEDFDEFKYLKDIETDDEE